MSYFDLVFAGPTLRLFNDASYVERVCQYFENVEKGS